MELEVTDEVALTNNVIVFDRLRVDFTSGRFQFVLLSNNVLPQSFYYQKRQIFMKHCAVYK